MKLMVAGCSFSAVSKTLPGTSWSEVLAKRLGWDLTNLARQGCSNGGIRIQIEEIRRQRPDFAIITPTFWDRMEIPANSAPYDWNQAPSSGENPPLERHLQNRNLGNGYRREDGIRNVNYGTEPSNMICETIFTLAENFDHPYRQGRITKQAQTGVRHWIDSIYDNAWKKQCDEWIMRDGITMFGQQQRPYDHKQLGRKYRYSEEEIAWCRDATIQQVAQRFGLTAERAAGFRKGMRVGYRWLPWPGRDLVVPGRPGRRPKILTDKK
jgi:hypothetical protein